MGLPCLVSSKRVLPVSLGAQQMHVSSRLPNLAVRGRWLKPIISEILDMAGKKYNNWLSENPRFIIALKNRNYRFSHNLLDPLMYLAPFQKVGFMLQRSLISYFLSILVNNTKHIFNTNYHKSKKIYLTTCLKFLEVPPFN